MVRATLFVLIAALVACSVSALQFDVGANQERCFVEEYPSDQLVVGEYHVLPGQFMDVEITVRDAVSVRLALPSMLGVSGVRRARGVRCS